MIDTIADARLRAARPTLADLIRIRDGSDPILTTWFLNRASYAPEELPFYPYELRRSYVAELVASERDPECCDECDDSCTADVCCHWPISDEVRFYAMDDASAWAWLRGTYRPESIASVVERVVTYREVVAAPTDDALARDCECFFDCKADSKSGAWHQHEDDPCPIHPTAPIA